MMATSQVNCICRIGCWQVVNMSLFTRDCSGLVYGLALKLRRSSKFWRIFVQVLSLENWSQIPLGFVDSGEFLCLQVFEEYLSPVVGEYLSPGVLRVFVSKCLESICLQCLENIVSSVGEYCLLCRRVWSPVQENIVSSVGEYCLLCRRVWSPVQENIFSSVGEYCFLCRRVWSPVQENIFSSVGEYWSPVQENIFSSVGEYCVRVISRCESYLLV